MTERVVFAAYALGLAIGYAVGVDPLDFARRSCPPPPACPSPSPSPKPEIIVVPQGPVDGPRSPPNPPTLEI